MRLILLAWAITFQMNLNAQQHHTEQPVIKNIPEILVKPLMGVMRISRDTIEYKVGNTLSPEIVKLEDLFRNFLGFNITDNGRIFYNGKEVSFLLIDGDPVSVSDYSIISQHLNANMFSSIELIQQYQVNRFKSISYGKNEIAINLKLKKEFRNRLNADILVKTVLPKGIYGNVEQNRIGSKLKSIAVLEKNKMGDRWEMKNTAVLNKQEFKVPLISLILHPFLLQSNLFKKTYLINSTGNRLQLLHAIKLGSFSSIRLEAGKEKVDLVFKENQQLNYFIGTNHVLFENRNSLLTLFGKESYVKLMFDHDHFKNNQGSYKVYFVHEELKQYLHDSITNSLKILNSSWDAQTRNTIMFQGEEKYFIGKKYLLEIGFEAASNNLNRMMKGNFNEKNEYSISQKYLSMDVGMSYQQKRHSFHMGHRFAIEKRELASEFRKQYLFVEHQYRLNKKVLLNTDASFGRGEVLARNNALVNAIYQFEGEGVYKKSMFNQTYLKYFISQRLPTIETWMLNPLLQLSGYAQYFTLPDRFSFIRKLEWGKTYQHLYRGFGFNYAVVSSNIKNDVFHSIGIHSFMLVDSIRFTGDTRNLQLRADVDQFIFPVKLRVSAQFQWNVMRMNQSLMGNVYTLIMNYQSVRFACKTSWDKSFQWEFSSSVQRNHSNTGSNKNNVIYFNHQLNSKYKISRKIFTAIQSTFIQTQKQHRYMFLDVLMQLKASEKFSIHISVLNAMNVNQFQQTYVSSYGEQSISTPLAGRKLQIEFRKSF